MKNIFIAHILLVLFLSACAVTPESENNEYKFSDILINNRKVSVIIETANISDKFIYGKPVWWGAEFTPPKSITKNIKVSVDNNSSWVPFSAYSDLVNVKTANLVVSKSGFKISIDGGQTSTHYIAHLYFDNEGFLISRKVYSPMFADEVWEETKYSFIRRNEM